MAIDYYIKNERRDFSLNELMEKDLPDNPRDLFMHWFQEVLDKQLMDANAMVLSTVSEQGFPSSRVVLMRDFTLQGITFYTHYNSEKGKHLSQNPRVALNFYWPTLDKQVRIEGRVSQISTADSDQYFQSRPRESQIGAWASSQSRKIDHREALEKTFQEAETKYLGQEVPRPETWGGYLVHCHRFEFWLGRPKRLHDRIVYTQEGESWIVSRLAP